MTQPSLPTSIGRYEIKGELGRGGMATVFHGFDPQVKRDVAIKILPPEFLHDPSFRARFEREVQTIALLEHPAIVPLYDFGEDKGQLYFVMRIMSGGSLADKLKNGPLSVEETASILARLAPALDEAHVRGIVHRDLKPGNILFDQRDSPYVSDFGIAKIATGGSTYTGAGLIGTPAYMSPEQARGEKEIDGRSDIYSLGGIVFEMLTGRLPYESDTPMGVIVKHITEPVPQILSANPDLPPAIETVIARAMAKDREDRFATAKDLASALSAAARGEAVAASPVSVNATLVHSGRLPAAMVQTQPVAPPVPQRKVPVWPFLMGGLVVAGMVVGALFGTGILGSRGQTPVAPTTAAVSSEQLTATAAAIEAASLAQRTATAGAAPTETADRQATNEALASVSQATGAALAQAGATAAAEATVGAQTTATAQAASEQQALFSEPKVAFVNKSDIWVVNPVDGSHLRQVTFDGGEKRSLRWLPDGQTIGFMSGRCILTTNIFTGKEHGLGCFNSSDYVEGFDVSSDGRLIAVSVDRATFITEFKPEVLEPITSRAELGRIATCASYSAAATRYVRLSRDGARIAVVILGQQAGRAADAVEVLGFKCGGNFDLKDLFPGSRFTMDNYEVHPSIETFGWNGESLFALIDVVRNGGFGDMYVYNSDTFRRPVKLNPVPASPCCYRDPQWSADGSKFAFAFQDILKGADSHTELYYVDYGTINTGKTYTPIPLPADFLTDPRESPQPVIAPPYQPTP